MLSPLVSLTDPTLSVRLSISVRSILIVTTSGFGLGSMSFISRLGFAGTFVKKRAGFKGDTTMKMIRTTNSTSISGVTLMYGFAWVTDTSGSCPENFVVVTASVLLMAS